MFRKYRIPFGPIPSRRLGQSLGINHIPPKICSYSCIYCQVGDTIRLSNKRQSFYEPMEVKLQVEEKVRELTIRGENIDYLSFVPDGEPTLDINLRKEADLLKGLGIPIAVITNGSLITDPKVRKDLMNMDWISLKVDAVTEDIWRRINRPHPDLNLSNILDGMVEFSKEYKGELNTETMLISGLNDNEEELEKISNFLSRLGHIRACISIPTRPPAMKWVMRPKEEKINTAYQIFKKKLDQVELLIGYGGNEFAASGNIHNDILDITAVHPMREEAIRDMLRKTGEDWSIVSRMLEEGELIQTDFGDRRFFMRVLPGRKK